MKILIEMSKTFAYPKRPLFLVIMNSKKLGFRLSKKTKIELQKNGSSGTSIYSIKLNEAIIWVSKCEFEENDFTEFSIPWDIVAQYDHVRI